MSFLFCARSDISILRRQSGTSETDPSAESALDPKHFRSRFGKSAALWLRVDGFGSHSLHTRDPRAALLLGQANFPAFSDAIACDRLINRYTISAVRGA